MVAPKPVIGSSYRVSGAVGQVQRASKPKTV
jgi:hypothetical protein